MTTQVAGSLLKTFVPDTGAGGRAGAVPAPAAGDAAGYRALFADGTWKTVLRVTDLNSQYLRLDGTNTPSATLNMATNKITGLGAPTANSDAATKQYVDAAVSSGMTIEAGAGLSFAGTTLNVGGTANRITVTADNVDIASTYVGQSSITTVGTISSGTWNGGAIGVAYGGTGTTTATGSGSNVLSASPALTGIPTAPTAAVDTNTTQLATTAFVIGQNYLKSTAADGNFQPLNAGLTSITAMGTGIPVKTSTTAFTSRTIVGEGTNIVVTNGNGVSGNPTITAGANLPKINGTNTFTGVNTFAGLSNDLANNVFLGGSNVAAEATNGFAYVPTSVAIPTGTPTVNTGRSPLVWNSGNAKLYVYSGGVWNDVGAGGSTFEPDVNPTANTIALRDLTGSVNAVSFNSSSDERLKTNITNYVASGSVLELVAKTFEWKHSPHKPQLGLIAQDVETILPVAVSTRSDGLKSINYDAIVAALITEVKSLKEQVNLLENKIHESNVR